MSSIPAHKSQPPNRMAAQPLYAAQPDLPHVPIERWLSAKEVAGHFGLSPFSAYRWVNEGLIPDSHVRYCGMCRIRLHPDVIGLLRKKFAANHA